MKNRKTKNSKKTKTRLKIKKTIQMNQKTNPQLKKKPKNIKKVQIKLILREIMMSSTKMLKMREIENNLNFKIILKIFFEKNKDTNSFNKD